MLVLQMGFLVDKKILFDVILNAIIAYRSKNIGLLDLVNRLMSADHGLVATDYEWCCDIDEYITQMEIIYSLLASGDKVEYSAQDLADIDSYLIVIEKEIRAALDKQLHSGNFDE
jgi:hypothetical protein